MRIVVKNNMYKAVVTIEVTSDNTTTQKSVLDKIEVTLADATIVTMGALPYRWNSVARGEIKVEKD